jgi:hypothetical protein
VYNTLFYWYYAVERNPISTPLSNVIGNNTMIRPPLFQTPEWDIQDKIDLIDAIIRVRPIGMIILAMKPNGIKPTNLMQNCKYVIDGYNRLCIIQEYMNNEFPWKNYYFSELTGDQKLGFYNYKISIQFEIIDKNSIMPIRGDDSPDSIISY